MVMLTAPYGMLVKQLPPYIHTSSMQLPGTAALVAHTKLPQDGGPARHPAHHVLHKNTALANSAAARQQPQNPRAVVPPPSKRLSTTSCTPLP